MRKMLMISPEKCTGCRTCEVVCSFNKTSEMNPKAARVAVIPFDEIGISVPVMCMQCDDPACMEVCPVNAIYKNEDGTVLINDDRCIGCKMCISACPLGNVTFSPVENKVVKCDLCKGYPMCARYCPSGAITYSEATPSNLGRKRVMADRLKEVFGEVNV